MRLTIVTNEHDPYDGYPAHTYTNVKSYWWNGQFFTMIFNDGARLHIAVNRIRSVRKAGPND